MSIHTKTLSVRVKDKHAKVLREMAYEVNQVFNLANEPTFKTVWLSAFDIQKQIAGIQKERGFKIGSASVQEIIAIHTRARSQFKKAKLRWRVSYGSKRFLGFVPFKSKAEKCVNGQVKFAGHFFQVWDSYGFSKYQFRAGNFSEDSRGRWYFNVLVQAESTPATEDKSAVGIDLGLKDVTTCSNGDQLESKQFYCELEEKLGKAQRANKKKSVKAVDAKIKNRRKDYIHKFTTRLVNSHATIKAIAQSVVFEIVNESYSTRTCSSCGVIPDSSPKGRASLRIREWSCSECGAEHLRDVNAAKNILAAVHCRLAGGTPLL